MDDLIKSAKEYKEEHGVIAPGVLQRKHHITLDRAKQICDELESLGNDWVETDLMPLPINEVPFLAKWHDISCLCQYDITEKSYYLICYPADQQSIITIPKDKSHKLTEWKKI